MSIQPIKFGKNLRGSTVEVIKKVNELVEALNIDPADIEQLKSDVSNLKTTVNSHATSISENTNSLNNIKKTQNTHTTDIDKIKVTLYTPLSAEDAEA